MHPKRIVALIGSPRKKETWTLVQQFEKQLRSNLEIEFEYVHLKACNLQMCQGCFLCLTRGEEYCPLKDDREMLVGKLMAADGVIFATPNYSLQVTAIMKNFLDRIAYTFHRPSFFHKPCMAIVTQGAIGASKILRYFKDVTSFTGFINVPGLALTTVSPRTADEQAHIERKTARAARRFSQRLQETLSPRPSIVQVLAFRMVRAMYRTTPDESLKDVRYFRDNGWLTAPYYYPVRLGLTRTVLGGLADIFGAGFARKRKAALEKARFGSTSNVT